MNRQDVQKRLLEAASSYSRIWRHIREDFKNVNIRNERERTELFALDHGDYDNDDNIKLSGTVRWDRPTGSLVSEVMEVSEDTGEGPVVRSSTLVVKGAET